MSAHPRGQPRHDALTPSAQERRRRFERELAEYINLAPDNPYLPALMALIDGLIVPALDVLGDGYGGLDVIIADYWPQTVQRSKSDKFPPPPPGYKKLAS